ncbi:hypothetical protein [Halorussus lipolyticus]|uniref:hypothetical protein n=1 Tax=Halorussus lipolyticus TaxID=3034024 RepID=UPI0023E80D3A|nr:hypothetical protein [Halorussus sp. DT80]
MAECVPPGVPGWVPDWVFCPSDRIIKVVARWLVGGILDLGEEVVGIVLEQWSIVRSAFGAAGGDVLGAGAAAGQAVEDVFETLNSGLLDLAASAGLAGPLVSALLFVVYAALAAALARGTVALARRVRIWVV